MYVFVSGTDGQILPSKVAKSACMLTDPSYASWNLKFCYADANVSQISEKTVDNEFMLLLIVVPAVKERAKSGGLGGKAAGLALPLMFIQKKLFLMQWVVVVMEG